MMTDSVRITQTESTHAREKTLLPIARHRIDLAACACGPPVAPAAPGPANRRNASVESNRRDRER